MNTNTEIWIGLIGIYPLKANTFIAQNQGAYTNVLLLAYNIDDYEFKVKEFLLKYEFEVFEMEDIESFSERIRNFEVDNEILDLANLVRKKSTPQISTLHVFDREDFFSC